MLSIAFSHLRMRALSWAFFYKRLPALLNFENIERLKRIKVFAYGLHFGPLAYTNALSI